MAESVVVRKALEHWRTRLTSPSIPTSVVDNAGRDVRKLVWDPVEAVLVDRDLVMIVAGGALASMAFAALPDDDGSYLIERRTIGYLESAQRLADWPDQRPAMAGSAFVVGGVDYGGEQESVQLATRAGADCAMSSFAPLPGTAAEADKIATALSGHFDVVQLSGAAAIERGVEELISGKQVVHLATHGFFADKGGCGELGTGSSLAGGLNPMSLSGLVLGGANLGGDAHGDGLWTAEEVSTLQLDDTQLVVLSACETGLGEESDGEVLMGLRRAFAVAGADTVVMSLWSVDDSATRMLMTDFYDGLFDTYNPVGALQALRQAQLKLLIHTREQQGDGRPALWAAFIASGDPR